jgi:hypothetical protein
MPQSTTYQQPPQAKPRRENKAQPSGPKGDTPATAGSGKTQVVSDTPENAAGQINPSAPNDAITPPLEP